MTYSPKEHLYLQPMLNTKIQIEIIPLLICHIAQFLLDILQFLLDILQEIPDISPLYPLDGDVFLPESQRQVESSPLVDKRGRLNFYAQISLDEQRLWLKIQSWEYRRNHRILEKLHREAIIEAFLLAKQTVAEAKDQM